MVSEVTLLGKSLKPEEKSRLRSFLVNHNEFLQRYRTEDPLVFRKLKELAGENIVSKSEDPLYFRNFETDSDGDVKGLVEGRLSPWDSEELGFKVAKLDHLLVNDKIQHADKVRGDLLNNFVDWCDRLGVDCIFARASLSDYLSIATFEKVGFGIADVLITFRRELTTENSDTAVVSKETNFVLEACREKDGEKIANLSREIFRADHFHNDPRIPMERSNHLYASWARNCCHGRSDEVLVARDSDAIAGFITCGVVEPFDFRYGVIELVGVGPRYRGLGLGRQLLKGATDWFADHQVQSIYVGTQADNYPALNLYAGSGFHVVLSELTTHWWP